MKVRLNKTIKGITPNILGDFGFKHTIFSMDCWSFAGCQYCVEEDEFNVFDTYGAIKLHFLLNKGVAIIEK